MNDMFFNNRIHRMGDLKESLSQWLVDNQEDTQRPVSTGLFDLDIFLNGYRPGNLMCLGGRPGVGKTAFLLSLIIHRQDSLPILFVSNQLSSNYLMKRLLSMSAEVPFQNFNKGGLLDEDYIAVMKSLDELNSDHIVIADDPSLNIHQIEFLIQEMKKSYPFFVCIIDGLEGLPDSQNGSFTKPYGIARFCKSLAEKYGIFIVVSGHVQYPVLNRRDPELRDVTGCKGFEVIADQFCILNCHDADQRRYVSNTLRFQEIEFIIMKNRVGPTGKCVLAYLTQWGRFDNYAPID